MPDTELKTCPFHSGKSKLEFKEVSTEDGNFYVVRCTDCAADGPLGGNVTQEIAFWNTRDSQKSFSFYS